MTTVKNHESQLGFIPHELSSVVRGVERDTSAFLLELTREISHGLVTTNRQGIQEFMLDVKLSRVIARVILDKSLLFEILDCLHPRNSAVLRAKYPSFLSTNGEPPKTNAQIGEMFGVSARRIGQIHEEALKEFAALARGYSLSIHFPDDSEWPDSVDGLGVTFS